MRKPNINTLLIFNPDLTVGEYCNTYLNKPFPVPVATYETLTYGSAMNKQEAVVEPEKQQPREVNFRKERSVNSRIYGILNTKQIIPNTRFLKY